MHGSITINFIVYWIKTDITWFEQIRLNNLANMLNCDCDIQLGQFPSLSKSKINVLNYSCLLLRQSGSDVYRGEAV